MKTTITQQQFTALETAFVERLEIERQEAQLAERKKANVAILAELGQQIEPAEGKTIAPGFQLVDKTRVEIGDETAAMQWVRNNPIAAGTAVQLSKDAVAVVWGFFQNMENFQTALQKLSEVASDEIKQATEPVLNTLKTVNMINAFELSTVGYEALVRRGIHLDIPHMLKEDYTEVRVTPKNLKTGDSLKEQFEITDTPTAETKEAANV